MEISKLEFLENSKILHYNFDESTKQFLILTNNHIYILSCDLKLLAKHDMTCVEKVEFVTGLENCLMISSSNPKQIFEIWHKKNLNRMWLIEVKDYIESFYYENHKIYISSREKLFIYDCAEKLHFLMDHDLDPDSNACPVIKNDLYAFPSIISGTISLRSFKEDSISLEIPAHIKCIEKLTISKDSTKIATVSEGGTIVRVFNTHNGETLNEIRRGLERCLVYSLSFNFSGNLIALTSENGTLHVFKLDQTDEHSIYSYFLPSYFFEHRSIEKYYVSKKENKCQFDEKDNLCLIFGNGKFVKIKR